VYPATSSGPMECKERQERIQFIAPISPLTWSQHKLVLPNTVHIVVATSPETTLLHSSLQLVYGVCLVVSGVCALSASLL
jgi:hypothetical protein